MLNFIIGCGVGCVFGIAGFVCGLCFAAAAKREDKDDEQIQE